MDEMKNPVDSDGYEILADGGEIEIGEVVEGQFYGVARTIVGRENGTEVPMYRVGSRTLIGSTVLRKTIEESGVKKGDTLKIARLADGAARKGQNGAKLYDIRVKRA